MYKKFGLFHHFGWEVCGQPLKLFVWLPLWCDTKPNLVVNLTTNIEFVWKIIPGAGSFAPLGILMSLTNINLLVVHTCYPAKFVGCVATLCCRSVILSLKGPLPRAQYTGCSSWQSDTNWISSTNRSTPAVREGWFYDKLINMCTYV